VELGQLITAVRDVLDDHATPPLYTDDELTRYLNTAVSEACLRARLLKDDSGDACRIALVEGTARYDIAPEVIVVSAVHVDGRSQPVIRTTAARLDRIHPGWSHEVQTNGVPEYAIFDPEQKTLTLYPAPAAAGTCYLRVWRLPDESEVMEEDQDEPVITLPDPESLKHWALHEAYLKRDSEMYDPDRAAQHEADFERRFGPRPDVHTLTLWSTQPITGPRRAQLDY
jgi:hypothetical protein